MIQVDHVRLAVEDLARSGIPADHAQAAGIAVVPDAKRICSEYASAPAIVIPYLTVDGANLAPPFARIRYLADPPTRNGNPFKAPKQQRYAQPSNSGVHAYFPPGTRVDWRTVADTPDYPLIVVEGEKKALSACLAGFATIGLGGVYNFLSQGEFLPELDAFKWKGRPVYICFDSDAAHNPQIQAAEARLATELSLRRSAVLHLVRLPNLPDGDKQGVDDYLLHHGPDALESILKAAPRMRKIDAEVVALNQYVAWVEKEGCVYDLQSKEFIQKSNFTNGSRYSALETMAPNVKGTGVKRISVSEAWLKHPHAQRYDYVVFQPEDVSSVLTTGAGGLALNMWTGWRPEPGDISPFLELSEFLFTDLRGHQDLPLKLLAFKAQNPGVKIPLAPVLVGKQGCISGDTRIAFEVRDFAGKRVNAKGGTMETLYRRFHKLAQKRPRPPQRDDVEFYVQSVTDEGVVFSNKISDVIDSGRKQVFEVRTARGKVLKTTADHKFLTENGYVALELLTEGSTVFSHGGMRHRPENKERIHRPEVLVKHRPVAPVKLVEGRYRYYRLKRYRAVYEAHMNEMPYAEYIQRLNNGDLEGLQFLPAGIELHHIDENPENNAIDNLLAVDPAEHKRLHWSENRLKAYAVPDTIIYIAPLGVEQVYDIAVADPYRNFIAGGVVVHNCGKSLWAECVRDAFAPYTAEIPSSALGSQFNGWTERTLIAVINEASGEILQRVAPTLRALISDKRVMLNDKFRLARQIDSYTMYIITSNDRGAGSYSADDRRMIVVNCPPKREDAFYRRVAEWKNSGGGRHLLHYLLHMDLQGWQPPVNAPMTAEKYMAYMENLTPVQRLAEEMRTANEHIIVLWIQQALAWAAQAELSNNPVQARYAQEIIDSLRTIQIRPWYTPEELSLMFPAIASQLHGARTQGAHAAGVISKELRTAGIGYLQCREDPRGFRWQGMLRQYLIVAESDEWSQPLSQAEFDRLMGQFQRYGDGRQFKR